MNFNLYLGGFPVKFFESESQLTQHMKRISQENRFRQTFFNISLRETGPHF
jgi:hypothetical protein